MKNIFWKKEEKKSLSPNILITNYCNQNCNFCFAKEVMKGKDLREMPMSNYLELIKKLKDEGIETVNLMGGEPTLHKNFLELIEVTLDLGLDIDLFTNGFFDQKVEDFLISKKEKINTYHINVTTPDYARIEKRDKVNDFIGRVVKTSNVSLEVTVDDLDLVKYLKIFDRVGKNINNVSVRIGVDGYYLNQGGFDVGKYNQVGDMVMELVDYLIKNKVKSVWLSEIYRCMFDEKQMTRLTDSSNVIISGFGCLSKRAGVDIKTDLKVIRCFSFEAFNGIDFNQKPLQKIKNILDKRMERKSKMSLPLICRKCKQHGYKIGMCPGPCLVGK